MDAGVPALFSELLYSHILFFALNKESQKYAQDSSYLPILIDFRDNYCPKVSFSLKDFPLYGPRLHYIQKRMNDWRPQRFRELRVRPYKDPVAHYTFWFAAYFGIVSVLALAMSIIQAYAALKML